MYTLTFKHLKLQSVGNNDNNNDDDDDDDDD